MISWTYHDGEDPPQTRAALLVEDWRNFEVVVVAAAKPRLATTEFNISIIVSYAISAEVDDYGWYDFF